ncbi:MAG: hypothetical protein JOZ57_13825, partial [Abitibacteriaceae bacterium]|nr:hypothetical protein [Abditibacteriaceae bacterium]
MTDHQYPSEDKPEDNRAEIELADHSGQVPDAIKSRQALTEVPLADSEALSKLEPASEPPLLAEPATQELASASPLDSAAPDETTLSDQNATDGAHLEPSLSDAPSAPPSDLPPADTPLDEPTPETWEDDENPTTLFLRALFTLLAGGFLSWAQNQAVINPGQEWNRWISLSVVANFLLPLGIVWMFFAQGLGHLDWLRDQKYNAWNYGWNFKQCRRHLKLALVMFAFMLPFLWFASRDPNTRAFYRSDATHYGYFPPITGASSWLW